MGGNLLPAALAFRLFAVLLPLALLMAVGLGYAATLDSTAPDDVAGTVGIREATLRSLAQSSNLESDARWLLAASALVMLVYASVRAGRNAELWHRHRPPTPDRP